MAENKDLEVWLAPIARDRLLIPFRVSARTMIGNYREFGNWELGITNYELEL
jgi:hypothetical protein